MPLNDGFLAGVNVEFSIENAEIMENFPWKQ